MEPPQDSGGYTMGQVSKSRKKEFGVAAEHQNWDYLKGAGPSAPPRILRDPPKDTSFKPDWKTRRPMDAIDPHRPSYNASERKEERRINHMPNRTQYLNVRDKQHGFNPITGQEYPNMRAHGGCMGPQGKKLLPEKPTIPPEVLERKVLSNQVRGQLRAERIANSGLPPGAKVNSVADNFDPIL